MKFLVELFASRTPPRRFVKHLRKAIGLLAFRARATAVFATSNLERDAFPAYNSGVSPFTVKSNVKITKAPGRTRDHPLSFETNVIFLPVENTLPLSLFPSLSFYFSSLPLFPFNNSMIHTKRCETVARVCENYHNRI